MIRKPIHIILAWLLLATALPAVGLVTRAEERQLAAVTSPLIQRYCNQAVSRLKKGDLLGARNAALAAWEEAEIQPPFPADGEPPMYSYIFPEGEALRFFVWERQTRIVYVEIKRGAIIPIWAAHLKKGAKPLPKEDTLTSYLNRNPVEGLGVAAEIGKRPKFQKSLMFFMWHPLGTFMNYGRITRDGNISDYGSFEATSAQLVKIEGEKLATPLK